MRVVTTVLFLAGLQLFPFASQATSSRSLNAKVAISVTGLKTPRIVARYFLSRPVKQIVFRRKTNGLRKKTWKLQTPSLEIVKTGIRSVSGKDFQEFSVIIRHRPGIVNSNYQPEIPIRDHGVALFTGYFNIAGSPSSTTFDFRSTHNRVIAYGKPLAPGERLSPSGNGTFVYFGDLLPIKATDSTMIIDPGMPKWTYPLVKKEVPAVVSYYTSQYAFALPRDPFLIFSWEDRNRAGDSSEKGDSLPGNIGFTLLGAGWAPSTKRNHGELAKIVAHELAHQWNAHLFMPVGFKKSGESWLAEGQAEYAATVVAKRFGWFTSSAALRHFTSLVNDCLETPAQHPIAEQRHSFRAVYGCGVTFNLLAQAILQKANPPKTFCDLWKAIYSKASKHHYKYSVATYVAELKKLSGNVQIPRMINVLANESAKRKDVDIIKALHQLGFGLKPINSKNHNPALGRIADEPLFTNIMKSDCDGRVNYNSDSRGFAIQPTDQCDVLDRPYTIVGIDGHKLFANGIAAYKSVETDCRDGKKIRLQVKSPKKLLTVACPSKIPPLPRLVDITSFPWHESSRTSQLH